MRLDRLVQVRGGLLEILEMLNRVGRRNANADRGHGEDRDSRAESPRERSWRAEEPGGRSIHDTGSNADQEEPDGRAPPLILGQSRVEGVVDELGPA